MTESAAGDWKTLSKYPFMVCEVRVDVRFVALPSVMAGTDHNVADNFCYVWQKLAFVFDKCIFRMEDCRDSTSGARGTPAFLFVVAFMGL